MSENVPGPVLSLSDVAQSDLAHLAMHAQKLSKIGAAIKNAPVGVELAGFAGAAVGLSVDESQRILSTIWNLYRLQRQRHLDSAKFIAVVTASLEKQTSDEWKARFLAAWTSSCSGIVSLLNTISDDHPFVVASKADLLGAAHQNCLVGARVITDVRPVFNGAGDKVIESLIIHTLLVSYFDGAETRRIEFALDASDVEKMRLLFDRAKRKATVLKSDLNDLPWRTQVFGEDAAAAQSQD